MTALTVLAKDLIYPIPYELFKIIICWLNLLERKVSYYHLFNIKLIKNIFQKLEKKYEYRNRDCDDVGSNPAPGLKFLI